MPDCQPPVSIICFYGPPGAGKTVCISKIIKSLAKIHAHLNVVHVGEPTDDPELGRKINAVYAAEGSGGSKTDLATDVQLQIMSARFQEQAKVMENIDPEKPTLIVMDGSVETDAFQYVQSKLQQGLITKEGYKFYLSMRNYMETATANTCKPTAYVRLHVGRESPGNTLWNRVHNLRGDGKEAAAEPESFALIERYSRLAQERLEQVKQHYDINTKKLSKDEVAKQALQIIKSELETIIAQ